MAFFLACKGFKGRVNESFLNCLFFSRKWKSAPVHQFHSLGLDQSTVALPADMTGDERSMTSCVKARSPHTVPYHNWIAWSTHTDLVGTRVYACLAVTCHLNFWRRDRDLLCATAITRE